MDLSNKNCLYLPSYSMVLRMHAGWATERFQVWIYQLSTFVKWLFTQLNKCYNIQKHTFSQGPPLKAAGHAKKIGSHYIFIVFNANWGELKRYHVDCGPFSTTLSVDLQIWANFYRTQLLVCRNKKRTFQCCDGKWFFFLWLNLSITFTDSLTQMISFESSWDQSPVVGSCNEK